jgi:hypothetical protein
MKTQEVAMEKAAFHKRGFTSLATFASFAVMGITGIVAYFMPEGRVAYWTDWRLLALTKYDWGDVHTVSSILFMGAAGFHLYFNWKPFTNYLAGKIKEHLKFGRELALTGVLTLAVVAGSIYEAPPFSYLLDLSAYLKQSWVKSKEYEPPFGHAELLSLRVFTKKMDIPFKEARDELVANGIKFESPEQSLEDIARANDTSAMNLYMLIKKFEPREELPVLYTPEMVEEKFAGTGVGRMTLKWMLEDIGVDSDVARKRLSANNIDIAEDETLKAAAERTGVEPIEMLKVIMVEGYEPAFSH